MDMSGGDRSGPATFNIEWVALVDTQPLFFSRATKVYKHIFSEIIAGTGLNFFKFCMTC